MRSVTVNEERDSVNDAALNGAVCAGSVESYDLTPTACDNQLAVVPAARVLLLTALFLSGALPSRNAAAAPLTAGEPVASGSRTTMILAPPLRAATRGGPCWQAARPGTIDTTAMAPVLTEVLHAVRSAAARSGGLEAIEIAIIGERDNCPARPSLRERLGAEIADYFVDWLAVNARTRILRQYLVESLIEEIGNQPEVYSWDPSSDSLRAVVELIVRSEPRDGGLPVSAASPNESASRSRRFAIIVRAAGPPAQPPATALPVPATPLVPSGPSSPAPRGERVEIQSESRSLHPDKRTAVGVRALAISALGTSHLGGQVEWTRSRSFGPVTASGGIRLGMLASDDEWANGGRLSRSSLGIVGVPVSVGRSVGRFRVHAGIVASGLIGLTAVRGEIEIGISRRLTSELSLGVAGGPAFTLASADTDRSGWSSAVCIERSLP